MKNRRNLRILDLFEIGSEPTTGTEIATALEQFVQEVRAKRETALPEGIPGCLIALACLKHRCPLPMELWASAIYPKANGKPAEVSS